MKIYSYALLMLSFATALPAVATVLVTSPTNGEIVSSTVPFAATANTTTCAKGVASMGVYIDNKLEYVVNGTSLKTSLSLASGKHNVAIQEWDYCGAATLSQMQVTVNTTDAVSVTLPLSNSTVTAPTSFIASATSSCASGVSAMGVYVDNVLTYKVKGSALNTQLTLPAGSHNTVVQDWDYCGGTATKSVPILVGSSGAQTIANIQSLSGWHQWGELAPTYDICTGTCNGAVTYSMVQHENAVSLSGDTTQFSLGGTTPYSDVLFSNPVIGQGNVEGLSDPNHLILPTLHNFTLDSYTYLPNLAAVQDLELDVNWYMNGVGMEWGTQCDHLGDGAWDLWDNVHAHWFSSGVPCALNQGAWNHIVIQVQREADNSLLYQTITVNGVVSNLNVTVPPFAVPTSWYGMTVNFQLDGNKTQTAYTSYWDKANLTYN